MQEKNLKIIVFACLLIATLIIVINFLFSDITTWDMPGHFFASLYIKEYLWPWPAGWNHLSFAGFPQGYFYPPLFHWIVAALGFIIPIGLAFKILVILSLFAIPFSFFFFAKTLGLKEFDSLLATVCMWLFLVPIKGDIGGDFYSTFSIGLVTAQFAFPFFFFYLAIIVKQDSLKKSIIAGILLSIIILSHSFTAVAAILSALILGIVLRKKIKYMLLQFIIAIGLSAFWIFPFVHFSEFKEGMFIGGGVPYLHPLIFYILLASIVFIGIKKDETMKPVLYLATTFIFLVQFFSYFSTLLPQDFPLHLFRFNIFVYCFFGIFISRIICYKPIERYKKLILFLLLFLTIVTTFSLAGELFKFRDRNIEIDASELAGKEKFGRGIVIASITPYRAPHAVWGNLLSKKIPLLNGLFVESSLSSRSINTLLLEIWPKSFVWGVAPYPINERELSFLLPYHLNYFGVCWILTDNLIDEKNLPEINKTKTTAMLDFMGAKIKYDYFIYNLNCNIIESVDHLPLRIESKRWSKEIEEWWNHPHKISRIYVKSDKPFSFAHPKKVEIEVLEARNDYYKFYINSQTEVPVLIKISYFPNWHAFTDGKPTKIYQASPNLMFVQAKGVLELKFTRSKIEILGYVFSLLTIVLCIFLLNYKKIRNFK